MRIAIAGYGAVGRALGKLLVARGDSVRIAQQRRPSGEGLDFVATDLRQAEHALRAASDVDVVVCTVGLPYRSAVWVRDWPIVIGNLLAGCAASGARFVFADNLYLYGPVNGPLTEDLPLTTYGQKPRVRAEITKLWQDAHREGRVRAVAVRAADFYGPDVPTSVLVTQGIQRLLAGKPALAPYPPDHPHDFTYVPDFARALVRLIDAPDDAYGRAWHVPNAPPRTLRQLLELAAELAGAPKRVRTLPGWLAPLLGLFSADLRELTEMRFQWDRPYVVDAKSYLARFGDVPTPFEEGLRVTMEHYRNP